MGEIYFYKEVYFVSLVEFRKSCLIISLMNPLKNIQHVYIGIKMDLTLNNLQTLI